MPMYSARNHDITQIREFETAAAKKKKDKADKAAKAAKDAETRATLNKGERAFESYEKAVSKGTVGSNPYARAAVKTHLGDVRAKRQRLRETLG